MKKFLYAAAFIVAITGCSSDDDAQAPVQAQPFVECTGTVNTSDFAGTWNYTFLRTEGVTESRVNGQSFVSNILAQLESSTTAVFTFNPDGTWQSTGTTTISQTRDGVFVGSNTADITNSGNYSINPDNTLDIFGREFAFFDEFEITLTNVGQSQMCWRAYLLDENFSPDGNTGIREEGTSYLEFTRQ
jgi:hypothetical protein